MISKTQLSIYVVCGLLIADFVLFGHLPAKTRLEGLQQALAAEQSAQRMAEVHRHQIPGLRARLAEYERILQVYQRRIPAEPQIGTFVREISDLMAGRLQDQLLVPLEPNDTEPVYSSVVQVSCSGSLVQVFEFLRRLRAMDRLVKVRLLRLANDHSLTGRLDARLELVVFHRQGARST